MTKAKKKEESKKKDNGVTVKDLIAVAEELNKLLDLDPALPTNSKTRKIDLLRELEDAAGELEPQDKLTDKTVATLKAIGIDVPGQEEKKDTKAVAKKAAEAKGKAKVMKKVNGEKKKGFSDSNKARIYLMWKDGEENVEKLHKKIKEGVKINTIRSWINQWKNKKNLPAIANGK